ncbi:MAG: hypothetical protein QI223_09390 [Candidatus Korarchaeota archaeon]|nr:hypothetical protein [Candidatus Korarchaeota archaeon]
MSYKKMLLISISTLLITFTGIFIVSAAVGPPIDVGGKNCATSLCTSRLHRTGVNGYISVSNPYVPSGEFTARYFGIKDGSGFIGFGWGKGYNPVCGYLNSPTAYIDYVKVKKSGSEYDCIVIGEVSTTSHRFALAFDIDERRWEFYLDGSLVHTLPSGIAPKDDDGKALSYSESGANAVYPDMSGHFYDLWYYEGEYGGWWDAFYPVDGSDYYKVNKIANWEFYVVRG